ncbi:major facilitator superfamily [Lecanosticta acicola]|uniref:Cercosporin MFS transporter CTB4 n=1 Tax=Lecanosticta acicola TaxID=111012 RepID=A0AAI9EBB6_9PEZI|nr:major facilitator superfamily [Lecanosticta acicola]
MNEDDRRLEDAERDASPDRFEIWSGLRPARTLTYAEKVARRDTLSRTVTGVSSASSGSSSSGEPVEMEEMNINRMPTQRDDVADLERHPTALSRIQTERSQHSATVGASLRSRTVSRHTKTPLPAFGGGKQYPPGLPEREEYVVEFDGPNDPLHAQNWPLRKKLPVALVLGFVTLVAAFGSSIFSTATTAIAEEFGFSREVGILGVSLYVLGFATGPIVWAPFSELYGRKVPLLVSSFGFSIFNIAVAVGKDAQTVFICRFFAGFMGACPLTCVGAVFADMFSNRQRGLAITVFSMTVFAGPLLAPFVGGFITTSYLGWRWTEYITAIMGFLGLGLSLLFLEETYPPVILVNKAADLRRRTKNWGIHAKQEEIEVDLRELFERNLSRPIRMLFTEPIVLLISIYMAFIYGLLYLFLTFYPIVFQQIHGFNAGVGGLPFFGMIVGEMLSGVYMIILQPSYNRKLAANNNMPVPEWRLPPVIVGGISFAIGLFWFGWTGFKKDIHWIAPTLSGLATGFGIMSIFLQCLNYLIDSYLMFAASAIAANTFLRSLAGAGFPLFATQMIQGMGVNWAGTLLGCVALVLVPMPVVFYLKGHKIREKSKFAPTLPMATQAANAAGEDSDPEKNE